MDEIAKWGGVQFGAYRGFYVIRNNIRIMAHTGGVAVFLPPEVWRPLDIQVPMSFPVQKGATCWIADRDFAMIKMDVDAKKLSRKNKDYASEDVGEVLRKVESFVEKNLFRNSQARPDVCLEIPLPKDRYTLGYQKDNPNWEPGLRIRTFGNFKYRY